MTERELKSNLSTLLNRIAERSPTTDKQIEVIRMASRQLQLEASALEVATNRNEMQQ